MLGQETEPLELNDLNATCNMKKIRSSFAKKKSFSSTASLFGGSMNDDALLMHQSGIIEEAEENS